jgi:uncharacterized repeat protein (TIGR03803 family)
MKTAALYTIAVILTSTFALGQQYKVLWSFAGPPNDGTSPVGDLVADHLGNLYGTTQCGGSGGPGDVCAGTIFGLSPNNDGSWTETILHNFCTNFINGFCLDGASPRAGLVLDAEGNLYGTTAGGGSQSSCGSGLGGCGTAFELSPPSEPGGAWTERVLYNFCSVGSNCLDGDSPHGALVLDTAGNLYGTTPSGGSGHAPGAGGGGTAFELSPGTGRWIETVLYNFCSLGESKFCPDGLGPSAGMTFDKSGNLYGTTELGGAPRSQGGGVVYKLSSGANGWTETVLAAGTNSTGGLLGTAAFDPFGNLYSTFSAGGPNGAGGVFRLGPGGAGTEFSFKSRNDGNMPVAGVIIDSKRATLYGTTLIGGTHTAGTVFQIIAPAQESVLYSFCSQTNCADGSQPSASLIEDKSGNLYGTARAGGVAACDTNGCGVVFEITP